jgi:2-haloacid dehalogenase
MDATRRSFLGAAATAATTATAIAQVKKGDTQMARPKVVFFDVNETLLDLKPLKESVAKALGDRPELVPLWFTTLLQYSLVTTVADRYSDFGVIGVACLRMVAQNQGINLSEDAAKKAVAPIRSLPPHPDVAPALARLRDAKYRLVTLTNSSDAAVADQLKSAKLDKLFEAALSVEGVGLYKPHAHVYRWAARRMGADVSDCLMVAAHGWDVAGAAWAGMRAAFVGRPGQQPFPLGPTPELTIATLTELADKLAELK